MRFNNPFVVFDLETTDCADHAITEVGAVVLTPQLHRVVGRFQMFVHPDRPVSDRVMELTGHSRESLDTAKSWPYVAAQFEEWVVRQAGKPLKNVRLAAWGNYFDINVLRNQYARHQLPYPFSGTCFDVKSAAMMWAAFSGRRTDSLSVQGAAKDMGLTPMGSYHRADVDADMTGQILQKAIWDIEGGVWVGKQYVRVRGGETGEG